MRPVMSLPMIRQRLRALALPLLALPLLALPALADAPRVVTDIPPVYALVAQVMGSLGTPDLLLDKGASEHDFQLRPSQAAALAQADLIVWAGPDLTPWLDRAVTTLGDGAPSLALLEAPQTRLQPYGAASDEDGGTMDPHAWQNPANAKIWLGLIAADLGRLDPDNAATYSANADKAAAGIDALDSELKAILAPARATPLVMAHAAYGYFATTYGLNIAGSIALGDATAPGAARLSTLQTTLESTAGICLFPEPQQDPALLNQLAQATGARVGGALDPVGSTLTADPEAYARLLRGLALTIAECAAR